MTEAINKRGSSILNIGISILSYWIIAEVGNYVKIVVM
jgi:hypothetical protein